ncbi:hypothetical protein ACH5RR_025951, partial [Cinchona calisaya]
RMVKTQRPENCELERVSDLIKDGKWDAQVLQRFFSNDDRIRISKIPLSIHQRKDRFFWKETKDVAYSVKSGYAVAKSMRKDD